MSRINIEDSLFNDPRMEVLMRRLGRELAIGHFVYISKLAQRYFIEGQKIPKKIWELSDFPKDFIDVGMVKDCADGYYLCGSEEHFGWLVAKKENGKKGGRPSKINNIEKATGKLNQNSLKLRESYENPPTPTPTPTNNNINSSNACAFKQDIEKIYLDHYPRRLGKKRGMNTLAKQIKNLHDLEKLKKAVINYKNITEASDAKFIKHFSTFANEWEDYIEIEDSEQSPERRRQNLILELAEMATEE